MIKHPKFSVPATTIKIASNGDWESSKVCQPGELIDRSEVITLVNGKTEIACEAFFGDAFFGSRRRGTADEVVEFVHTFTNAVAEAPSGEELLRRLASELQIPIGVKFKFAEVGAVDAWNSVGAFQIKDPAEALKSWNQLLSELQESSVGRENAHLKAVEFAFDNEDGTTHWIALPISEGTTIVAEKLKAALESYCEENL